MAASTLTDAGAGVDTPGQVLAAVRWETAAAHRAEARTLRLAVDWAAMHSVDSIHEAATLWAPRLGFEEDAVPVAGPGAPLVAEFCVAEFAAALGMPTEHGRLFLGEALELRYRLPRVWRRVAGGDLPAWRARRIARETICLSAEAAAHVDRHVGPVAHKIGPVQTERLVEEAIARFMPETAEETRQRAADGRHFTVDHEQVSFAGTSLPARRAGPGRCAGPGRRQSARTPTQLKDLGATESLDVRRSVAAGELARRQLALDLTTDHADPADSPVVEEGALAPVSKPRNQPRRPVTLYLHLHQSAIEGTGGVGRVENTRSLVTADQIRTWCGHPDAQVTVKPVIDLADHVHVDAYEVPDRIAEPVALRDVTCVFPWCSRPARRLRPGPARLRLRPRRPPHPGRGRPARATSRPCADDIIDSRPTAAGPTPSSSPAATCGRPRTATSTSATTPAPSTSPATDDHPPHHPTSSHPAPHPARQLPRAGASARPVSPT